MNDKDLTLWLRLRDDASKSLRSLLPSLKQIGTAVGIAAAAGVALSVNSFVDFQAALNNVQAVSQATGAEMERFKAQALEMGAATKFSAQEAAEAQGFLAMAGLSVEQSLAALPDMLQLAAAGNLDLARATDIATDVMSGYRLEVEDLGRINDVIATTAANANTNIEQVGQAMVYVGPVAAAAGLAIEETSAAIGMLANAGFKGEMGGTALRGAITKLLNPSIEAKDILGDLGVTVLDSTGKMRPFASILDELERGGITAGEAMKVFGQRAGPGMLALVSQGGNALRDLTRVMEESEGATQRMAEVMQQGIVGSFTRAKSAASTLSIMIGGELAPMVSKLTDGLTSAAGWMGQAVTESDNFRAALVGVATPVMVLVTAKIGLMVIAMGKLAIATTVATGGMNLVFPAIVLGIGTASAAMWKFRDTIATVIAAGIDIFTDFNIAMLVQFDKIARISDKFFNTDFHNMVAQSASDIEQFRVDAGESLRGYANDVRGVADDVGPPMLELADLGFNIGLSLGAPGGGVKPSVSAGAKEATEALAALREETGRLLLIQEDEILVTNTQWAAYQRVFEIGTPVTRMLSSQNIEVGKLGMSLPMVSAGLVGTGGVAAALATTGGAATTFIDTLSNVISADNITSIFTAAFTGAGGVLGALKAIGAQLASTLSKSFLGPLASAISSGIKGIFMGGGGALASTGLDLGAGTGAAAAGAAGGGIGLGGIVSAIPLWGWAAAGVAAAFFFFRGFGGPSQAERAGRETAAAFRDSIIDGLSPDQMAEARAAGESGMNSVTGAALHIAIRDAKLAAGATIEEAERAAGAMVAALHAAEKEGPESVQRVMNEINTILDEGELQRMN